MGEGLSRGILAVRTWMKPERFWTICHGASLVAVAIVLAWAARGQWFFYDEWDFLVTRNEWELLAPHNGHLSFAPALITTLLKLAFGLKSYWPFLAVTLAIHLLLVHILWRVLRRLRVHDLVAALIAVIFAVLGPGAENTLWAFQTGFIAPLLCGLSAFLIADRESYSRSRGVAVAVLLVVSLTFSGTAIPIVGAVLLFVWVRHGIRVAIFSGLPSLIIYGSWYLIVALPANAGSPFSASSLGDLLIRMPVYVAHGLVDSFAAIVPFGQLASVLLAGIVVWLLSSARHSGLRGLSIAHFLTLAAVVFAVLTGYTRVKLGVESASAGRYVYVYFLLLAPAIGMALMSVISRSRLILSAITVVLIVVAGYNAGMLVVSAKNQASLEQTSRKNISAALILATDGHYAPATHPLPVLAPTLTLADIQDFVRRGQLIPIEPDETALLSTEVNMDLRASAVPGRELGCSFDSGHGDFDLPAGGARLVSSKVDQSVPVQVERDGVISEYTQLELYAGANRLTGFDKTDITLLPQDAGSVCVPNG